MMSKEYDIGYGKPPKDTQFKPGSSGNPAGRPKGVKNLATDLVDELGEKVLVTEGAKQVTITKQRAMVKSLMAKALKGDVNAANTLIKLILGSEEKNNAAGKLEELSTDDQAVLDSFQAQILGKSKSTKEGAAHEK
jgi:hypothetical protein